MASKLGRAARAGRIVKGPSPTHRGGPSTEQQSRGACPEVPERRERRGARGGQEGEHPGAQLGRWLQNSKCAGQARPRAKGLNYQGWAYPRGGAGFRWVMREGGTASYRNTGSFCAQAD